MPDVSELAGAGAESASSLLRSRVEFAAIGGAEVAAAAGGVSSIVQNILNLASNPIVAGVAGGALNNKIQQLGRTILEATTARGGPAFLRNIGEMLMNVSPKMTAFMSVLASFGANVHKTMDEARDNTAKFTATSNLAFDPKMFDSARRSIKSHYTDAITDSYDQIFATLQRYGYDITSQADRQAVAFNAAFANAHFGLNLPENITAFYREMGVETYKTTRFLSDYGHVFRQNKFEISDALPTLMRVYDATRLTGGSLEGAAKAFLTYNEAVQKAKKANSEISVSMQDISNQIADAAQIATGGMSEMETRAKLGIFTQRGYDTAPKWFQQDLDKAAQEMYQKQFTSLSAEELANMRGGKYIELFKNMTTFAMSQFSGNRGYLEAEAVFGSKALDWYDQAQQVGLPETVSQFGGRRFSPDEVRKFYGRSVGSQLLRLPQNLYSSTTDYVAYDMLGKNMDLLSAQKDLHYLLDNSQASKVERFKNPQFYYSYMMGGMAPLGMKTYAELTVKPTPEFAQLSRLIEIALNPMSGGSNSIYNNTQIPFTR